MKRLLPILACILSFPLFGQISGSSSVQVNQASSYTYDNGSPILGGVINWSATNGTIISTSSSGTAYSASISFQSAGSKTITARHGYNNNILATYTVSVAHPPLSPGSVGNSQTLCYSGNPSTLSNTASATGGNGSYAYQWQHRSPGGSWSSISGATSTTYDPPALTSTKEYRRRVISNGQTAYSNTRTVTIYSNLSPGSIGNTQTVCYNGDPAGLSNTSSASGSSGTKQYQWQQSSNGSSGWTDISGATGTTYNPGTLTANKWYRRRVRTSTCSSYKYTNTLKITVRSSLSSGSIGNAQTLCYNGNPAPLTNTSSASGGDGSYTYQWQVNAGSGNWLAVSNGAAATYDPGVQTSTSQYRRKVTSCGQETYSNSITVTVSPNLSAGSIGNSQSLCYGVNPSILSNTGSATGGNGSIAYQWQHRSPGGSWSTISGATSTSYDPPVISSTKEYRRRAISCGQTVYSNSRTVTIYSDLTAGSIGNAQTLCYSENPSAMTNTSSASGSSGTKQYQWQQSSNGSSGWTDISGATSTTYTPGALTSNKWYRRRVRTSTCSSYEYTNTIKMTVSPNLVAGSVGNAQTVCYNGNPAPLTNTSSASGGDGTLTYQWQVNAGSGNWLAVSNGAAATYDPGVQTSTSQYRRKVTSCGQETYSNSITVTVSPNLSAGSIGNSQSLCYGVNPSILSNTGSATGGNGSIVYQWEHRSPEGSWSTVSGATSTSYDPPVISSTKEYRRRAISCGQTVYSNTRTVIIYSDLTAGIIGNAQTLCYSENPSAMTNTSSASGSSGTKQYQWQQSSNGSSGWTNISSATGTSYDPGTLTANTWYRRRVRTSTCSSYEYTNSIKMTVRPNLVAGSVGNAQTVCYNGNPAPLTNTSSASGGDGTLTYQWQVNAGSGNWLAVSNGAAATYDPGVQTSTSQYRRKVTSCGQETYSNSITVTVSPNLSAGSIGNSQSLCYGVNPSILSNTGSATGGNGSIVYQWEHRSPEGSWSTISGATSTSYDPPVISSTKEYRRRAISCGQTVYSNTRTVIIYSDLTAGIIGNAQTLCYSENPSAMTNTSSASGSSGTKQYQWQQSSNGSSGWTNISSATGTSYDPGTLTANTWYRRRVRTSTCSSYEYTNSIKMTVRPNLVAGSVGNAQTVCYNGNPAPLTNTSSASGGDGSFTYQWQQKVGNNWFAAMDGEGDIDEEIFDPGLLTTTAEYRRKVTSCGQEVFTPSVIIAVNPSLNGGAISNSQTIHYNTSPAVFANTTAASGGDNAYIYQWQVRDPGGNWGYIIGANGATYNPGLLTSTKEYQRETTSCGQVEYTAYKVITVLPEFVAGTIGNNDLSICSNTDPALISNNSLPTGGDESYAYQWQQRIPEGSWSDIGGATNSGYDPPALSQTTEYRRMSTSFGLTKESNIITINIYDDLDAGDVGNAQTICFNGNPSPLSSTASASGGDGNLIYQWQQKVGNNWFAAMNGEGDIDEEIFDPGLLTATAEYRRRVTSCGQEVFTPSVIITVNPSLDGGTIGNPQTLCYGENPTVLSNTGSATGGDGSIAYQWEHRTLGGSWSPVLTATATSYDPPALTSTKEYRRKVFSCGQTDSSNIVTVIIHPDLDEGAINNPQTLCYNEDPSAIGDAISASGSSGTIQYQWQQSSNGSNGWTDITGATVATYDPDSLTADTWYRRGANTTSCSIVKYTSSIKVTVHPNLSAGTIGNTQTICFNGDPAPISSLSNASGGDGSLVYQWQVLILGNWFGVPNEDGATYDAGTLTETQQYRRKVTSCGQEAYSNEITITVLDELLPGIISTNQTVCHGSVAQSFTESVAADGGDNSYSYQWQEKLSDNSWQDITGATLVAYTYPTTVTEIKKFRRKVSSCSQESISNTVAITPMKGFAGFIDGPSYVFKDDSTSGFLSLNAPSNQVDWYVSDDAEEWSLLSTSGMDTLNLPPLAFDSYYRAEVTTAGGCKNISEIHHVDVITIPTLDIIPYSQQVIVPLEAETNVENIDSVTTSTSYTYIDGLGRTVQQVSKGASPAGNDIVSFQEYKADMTVTTSYLPYVTTSGDDYYADPVTDQLAFYHPDSASNGIATDAAPYAKTQYKSGPRRLVLEQGAVGADWQLGSGHTATFDYRFNTLALGDTVPYFNSDLTGFQIYADDKLSKTEITDENQHRVVTYSNHRGQTVLKKVEQQSGVFASTASVYDELGRLRFVLPPEAMKYVEENSGTWTKAILQDQLDLIYEYAYDAEGRLMERKIPGKGEEYIVYDPFNRPALTQDAIMRTRDQWAFSKTDRLGRVVYSGLFISDSTRTELQAKYDELDYDNGDPFYEKKADSSDFHGFTNTVYPTQNLEVHAVNYYDNYAHQSNWEGDETSFNNPDEMHSTQMDGTSQYIALNQFYNQPNSIEEVTIEAWINTSYSGSGWTDNWAIIDFDRSDHFSLFVHGVNGKLGFSTKGGNLHDFYSNTAVNDGEWHHVAATFDGVNKRVYIDGVLDNEVVNPHNGNKLGTSNIRYGFIGDGSEATSFNGNRNKKYFQGKIGEVRLWHSVRSENELSQYMDVPLTGNEDGLVGKWSMSSIADGVEDETGNGNSGTVINGATQTSELKQDGLPLVMSADVRGLLTGNLVKVDTSWLSTTLYYNDDLRVIQTVSSNHLGGEDRSTAYYDDFTGRMLKNVSIHHNSKDVVQTTRTFDYDNLGRMTDTWHQLNNNPVQHLSSYDYNELGQLKEKDLHLTGSSHLQSIDYQYNIRGWLKSINDPETSDDGDAFGMAMFYNESDAGLSNTATYNGNISAIKWSSYDSESVRAYNYTYDASDRLTEANHKVKQATWTDQNAFTVPSIAYDANGNINALQRKGNDGNIMDDLAYSYIGNQLQSISDSIEAGFKDGNTVGDDYAYDVNGNLTKDLNKAIDSITYNHLDLPIKIILGDSSAADSLTYLYSASGAKLRMTVWENDTVRSKVDYLGGFRYENDIIQSIAHEEGRIIPIYSESNPEVIEDYDYQYTLTDHLGNTRRVLSTKHEEYTTVEDFEDSNSLFTELNLHTSSNANATTPLASNNGVSLLAGQGTGALIMLHMDKGDTVDLKVQANYETDPASNSFANTLYNMLHSSWSSAYGSSVEGGSTGSGAEGAFQDAIAGFDSLKREDNTAPRAFLNYIFFDMEMNYKTAGFRQISTNAKGLGAHESLEINDIIADQGGYLLAYLSNENQDSLGIHFDDFEVTHSKTNVVQAVDYYPFGLIATSHTRTSADPTKYLYNGGVEQNDYTSYYETFYRNYDASIGRFMGVDIKAASFTSQTPYQYAFNDPVSFNDPLGDAPMGDLYSDHHTGDSRFTAGFAYVDGKGFSHRYGGHSGYGATSGNHWTNQYNSASTNLGIMSNSTFRSYYGIDQMSGQDKANFAKKSGLGSTTNTPNGVGRIDLTTGDQNVEFTDFDKNDIYSYFLDGKFHGIGFNKFFPVQNSQSGTYTGWTSLNQTSNGSNDSGDSYVNPYANYDFYRNATTSILGIFSAGFDIGNYQKPINMHINDFKGAQATGKLVSKGLGGLSLGVTLYDINRSGLNTSNGMDLAFGLLSFTGAGAVPAGIYFALNFGTTALTGHSIGEHIDDTLWVPGAMGPIPVYKFNKYD